MLCPSKPYLGLNPCQFPPRCTTTARHQQADSLAVPPHQASGVHHHPFSSPDSLLQLYWRTTDPCPCSIASYGPPLHVQFWMPRAVQPSCYNGLSASPSHNSQTESITLLITSSWAPARQCSPHIQRDRPMSFTTKVDHSSALLLPPASLGIMPCNASYPGMATLLLLSLSAAPTQPLRLG